MGGLRERLASVRARIAQACRRCGRDPLMVTLVAVTKGVDAPTIREAIALGLRNLGENRIQEARSKQSALGSRLKAEGVGLEPRALSLEQVRWHLIGHLQRNKAKEAVELFEVIHSLDSSALAETLERHAERQDAGYRMQDAGFRPKPIEVFIQVNVSGEKTKFGCPPEETPMLAQVVKQLPHLHLKGLMTIAPFADDPETARPIFRQLRGLRDVLTSHFPLPTSDFHLSMGMSQDFEVAIEEGADVIRVGTAIFGP